MSTEKNFKKTAKTFVLNLKAYRKKLKLSQTDMGDLGWDVRTYQKFEAGTENPTLYTIQRLADDLETDVHSLLKPVKKS